MNIHLIKIVIYLSVMLLQLFLILEIERCWLLLKGKKSETSKKLLEFIQLPFVSVIKNQKTLQIASFLLYPVLFGVLTAGIIPFLNMGRGMNIQLGDPWGYIAMFGIGYVGTNILILISCIHTKITFGASSINLTAFMILFYLAVFILVNYFQFSLFLKWNA